MKRILLILLCHIVLINCAPTSPADDTTDIETGSREPTAQTFVYECPDNFSFVARIESGKAWLFLPGNTMDLPQVTSASGTKYSDSGNTFWSKADEAMVETGDGKHTACRNNRAKAIWEHAKLNGADFRAIGNEPGWHMEISNSADILLVTDYGQNTYRFKSSTISSVPPDRTTTYNASNTNDTIAVIITGAQCTDSMSGEAFPAQASVLINGKRYSGCGKALH